MKNGLSAARRTGASATRVDGEPLAIRALEFLAAEPERIDRFIALSGLDPGTLRRAALNPGFLLAVLDHLVEDEPLLTAFADAAGLHPLAVVEAHDRLRRDQGWTPEPSW